MWLWQSFSRSIAINLSDDIAEKVRKAHSFFRLMVYFVLDNNDWVCYQQPHDFNDPVTSDLLQAFSERQRNFAVAASMVAVGT
jgi:hypothetical protein